MLYAQRSCPDAPGIAVVFYVQQPRKALSYIAYWIFTSILSQQVWSLVTRLCTRASAARPLALPGGARSRSRTADRGVHDHADGDEEADGIQVDVGQRVDHRHAALQHGQRDQQVGDDREAEERLRGAPGRAVRAAGAGLPAPRPAP